VDKYLDKAYISACMDLMSEDTALLTTNVFFMDQGVELSFPGEVIKHCNNSGGHDESTGR
jgi:hypothetical protein